MGGRPKRGPGQGRRYADRGLHGLGQELARATIQEFEFAVAQVQRADGTCRYTDVLVRTEDGWKFLAWHGGDDD